MMTPAKPKRDEPYTAERVAQACAAMLVVILAAVILANSMMKSVSRDEHMYCSAGVLLEQGRSIYRDFAYPSQLPYHPLLLRIVYGVLPTSRYLLVGRLVSVLCNLGVVALILAIYRRAFGANKQTGRWLGWAAVVLYTFNPVVAYTNGFAWNHDVVTFCVVLSFWLFACTDIRQGPHPWRLASMGALLTFATCMRVTTVLAGAVFLAAIAITAGGSIRNRVRTALPFIIAGILTLLWPLWTVMRAPRAAWLNLVRIPALYGRWLHELGLAYDKVSLTIDCLATPGYLSVLVLTGCLVAVVLMRRSRLGGAMRRNLFVASALAAVFCLIAFIPPTMWHQYWAVPVPFLVIVCAYPIAALRQAADEAGGRRSFRVACGLVVVAATVAVVANLNVLRRLPAVLVPERWAPVALHDVATDVARKTAGHGRVLTLGPLYALEGGCDIYPALASGSIIYRVADAMSAEDRRITHTVGLGTLGALLDQSPPSAVILGVEPSHFSHLEEPLFRAVGPGWLCEVHEYGIEVYFRP